MLEIKNLKASIDNKEILNSINLSIKSGEVHAIMGPNGSGKSTLSNILSGKKGYEISGEIKFENDNLLELEIEERAHKGIFLAFQYPPEIPGVNINNFLKTSLNAIKKANGQKELDAIEFLKLLKEKSRFTKSFTLHFKVCFFSLSRCKQTLYIGERCRQKISSWNWSCLVY